MNEPLLTLGALFITPFSLAAFAGAVLSALLLNVLAAKRKIQTETSLLLTLLSVCLGLFTGHLLFAAFQLYIDPFSYDHPVAFLLDPGMGGQSFTGVLGGAFLACLICAKLKRCSFDALAALLVPALMLLIAVIRFAEPLEELGKGPESAAGFFPLAYAPNPEYDDVLRVPVFFYEGLLALGLSVYGALKRARGTWQTCLLIFMAGQMFFEVYRQDIYANYMSLITFVRINQLLYVLTLAGLMLRYTLLAAREGCAPKTLIAAWAVFLVCVGLCIGLQFLFDKPIHLFGENVFLPDWLVYTLLAVSAAGMGWSALRLLSKAGRTEAARA